ncbi:MAG: V-type ATP synthase subunit I [Bacillota bacterium]
MAVLNMRKLVVAGLEGRKTPFIHDLMHLGVIELNSQDGFMKDEDEFSTEVFRTSNSAEVGHLDAEIARVSIALDMIATYSDEKKPFLLSRKSMERSDFTEHLSRYRTETERNVDTAVEAHAKIMDGQNEINRLNSLIIGLSPWKTFDVPLNLRETEFAKVILGSVGLATDINALTQNLLTKVPSASVQQNGQDDQQQYLSIICLIEDDALVYETLREYTFNPIQLLEYDGLVQDALQVYEQQIMETQSLIKQNEGILASLAPARPNIEFLYDSLHMSRDRAAVVSRMLNTDTTFYFDGWFPAKAQKKIEAVLNKYECYYEISEPDPDEDVPVLLQNGNFATPFESVTNMYSLPGKGDIDPTTVLAPFYFIFFGMMLSDAAYGLILVVLTAIAMKKFTLEGSKLKMVKMFYYCGWSTFMWGALFGGWFGDFFTVAAKTLFDVDFVIPALWFDPLAEPMTLLIFSLILGVIHLFVGMGMQAYILIKDGKMFDAICDIFLWYALLVGAVLFGIGGSISPGATMLGQVLAIVGAVGILLTGGRKKSNLAGKLMGGLGSLYGITGYLSDVLSYSRLLALGLATGVVAKVINTLGSLAGGGIAGAFVLLIALVFGTIFNVAINALGAFVHSCRLQYVEFFGKFYTGGGRAFAPFERQTKYVRILKEEESNG